MKHLLYFLFFTLSLSLKSQITFEKNLTNINKVTFTNYGDKYYTHLFPTNQGINPTSDTITIYNTDWTIFRVIKVPPSFLLPFLNGGYPYINGTLLSDNLFNTDSLIEYVGCQPTYNGSENLNCKVFDEHGNTVYTFQDSITGNSGDPVVRVLEMGGSFKLQLGYNLIYSVPGTLPCNQCNYTTGITEPTQGGELSRLNVYPNPFNNNLEINYNFLSKQDNPQLIITDILGRELKTIPLINQSDKITLNTTDLPRGTMILSLYGNSQDPISKKVIKIN